MGSRRGLTSVTKLLRPKNESRTSAYPRAVCLSQKPNGGQRKYSQTTITMSRSLNTVSRKTTPRQQTSIISYIDNKLMRVRQRKIKVSAPRLAKTKQKGAHQKDHLYQKDNTPRPQNKSLRTSACKNKTKTHIKMIIYTKDNTPRPRLNDSERAKTMEKSNRRLTRL